METLVPEHHLSPLHNHLHGPLSGPAYQKAMEDAQNGLLELQMSREFSTRSGSEELSTSSTDSRSSSLSPLSSPDISQERHFSTIMPSSERMQASKMMEVTRCMFNITYLVVVVNWCYVYLSVQLSMCAEYYVDVGISGGVLEYWMGYFCPVVCVYVCVCWELGQFGTYFWGRRVLFFQKKLLCFCWPLKISHGSRLTVQSHKQTLLGAACAAPKKPN